MSPKLGRRSAIGLVALAAAAVGCGFAGSSAPGAPSAPATPSANDKAADEIEGREVKILATLTATSPAGGQLEAPHGVAVDADGNVYVADTGRRRVAKFGPDGRFVHLWDSGTGEEALETPVDLTVSPTGTLYVLDKGKGLVHAYSREGQLIGKYGSDGAGFYNPFGLGSGPDGYFVADTGTGRVVKYNPTGGRLAEMGGRGSGAGELKEPTGVITEPDGAVTVVDGARGRLFRYGADGAFQSAIDVAGRGTMRAARMADGSVLVSDPLRGRLFRWDASGKLVGRYGDAGPDSARLNGPVGVAVDRSGNIWVADTQNNRVLKIQLD
jgi:DNA-binding beta-propeller fold protein YncE